MILMEGHGLISVPLLLLLLLLLVHLVLLLPCPVQCGDTFDYCRPPHLYTPDEVWAMRNTNGIQTSLSKLGYDIARNTGAPLSSCLSNPTCTISQQEPLSPSLLPVYCDKLNLNISLNGSAYFVPSASSDVTGPLGMTTAAAQESCRLCVDYNSYYPRASNVIYAATLTSGAIRIFPATQSPLPAYYDPRVAPWVGVGTAGPRHITVAFDMRSDFGVASFQILQNFAAVLMSSFGELDKVNIIGVNHASGLLPFSQEKFGQTCFYSRLNPSVNQNRCRYTRWVRSLSPDLMTTTSSLSLKWSFATAGDWVYGNENTIAGCEGRGMIIYITYGVTQAHYEQALSALAAYPDVRVFVYSLMLSGSELWGIRLACSFLQQGAYWRLEDNPSEMVLLFTSFFANSRLDTQTLITPPYPDALTSLMVVTFVSPVVDDDGNIIGMTAMDVSVNTTGYPSSIFTSPLNLLSCEALATMEQDDETFFKNIQDMCALPDDLPIGPSLCPSLSMNNLDDLRPTYSMCEAFNWTELRIILMAVALGLMFLLISIKLFTFFNVIYRWRADSYSTPTPIRNINHNNHNRNSISILEEDQQELRRHPSASIPRDYCAINVKDEDDNNNINTNNNNDDDDGAGVVGNASQVAPCRPADERRPLFPARNDPWRARNVRSRHRMIVRLIMFVFVWVIAGSYAYREYSTSNLTRMGVPGLIARFFGACAPVHTFLLVVCMCRSTIGIIVRRLPRIAYQLQLEYHVKYHAWLAYMLAFDVLAHLSGHIAILVLYRPDPLLLLVPSAATWSSASAYWTGIITFLLLACIVIFALVSQGWYRLFYWTHRILVPVFLVSLAVHGPYAGGWIAACVLLYGFDYTYRHYWSVFAQVPLRIIRKEKIGDKFYKLTFMVPGPVARRAVRSGRHTSGDFFFLKNPEGSSEWHPFTPSSPAPCMNGTEEYVPMVFVIEEHGNWTRHLIARLPDSHQTLLMDGPYPPNGVVVNVRFVQRYTHILWVASGSSRTPALSVISDLIINGLIGPGRSLKHVTVIFWGNPWFNLDDGRPLSREEVIRREFNLRQDVPIPPGLTLSYVNVKLDLNGMNRRAEELTHRGGHRHHHTTSSDNVAQQDHHRGKGRSRNDNNTNDDDKELPLLSILPKRSTTLQIREVRAGIAEEEEENECAASSLSSSSSSLSSSSSSSNVNTEQPPRDYFPFMKAGYSCSDDYWSILRGWGQSSILPSIGFFFGGEGPMHDMKMDVVKGMEEEANSIFGEKIDFFIENNHVYTPWFYSKKKKEK